MKYKIGDKVIYKNKQCVVVGVYESTNIGYTRTDEKKPETSFANIKITYDLKSSSNEVFQDVNEYELKDNTIPTNQFEDGEEFVLRNGWKVEYDELEDALETDDGVQIPADLYNDDGTCMAGEELDIMFRKYYDDDEEEQDGEDYITLSSDGKKYQVKVINKPYGFGIIGELPDSMKENFEKALKTLGGMLDD